MSDSESYRSHLRNKHGVSKNVQHYLDKALAAIKTCAASEEKEKAAEVSSSSAESSLETSVRNAIRAFLLDPVKLIIQGEHLEEPSDSQVTDEQVLESFEKIKNLVDNLKVPAELCKSLSVSPPEQEESEIGRKAN